ncbi:MAG: sulfatase-like hydrolase/transferase [Anaerolineales bacterium]|nr:sulfatase-like hydrolase/transferase [Anaerolineales bacterium]
MTSRLTRRDFLKLTASAPLMPLAASAKLPAIEPVSASASQPGQAGNILVLIYDAFSATHMPLYGYPRQTSPNLSRFAERATVYHAHYAASNFTTPGTASMLTGTYPWTHRALHLHGDMLEQVAPHNFFRLAGEDYYRLGYSHNLLVTTLLYQMRQDMQDFKYPRELMLADTAAADRLTPEDYNAALWSEDFTLRGYDTHPGSLFLSHLNRLAEALKERALLRRYGEQFPQGIPNIHGVYYLLEPGIDWMIAHLSKLPQPFLAYLHFYPPHHPYYTRREFVGLFDDGYTPLKKPRHQFSEKDLNQAELNRRRQAYDEYIAYADSEFGRLYDQLVSGGMLDSTTLLFTSDHGEMFERGIWGHNLRTLFEPVIHVPLIISRPGQTQRQDIYTPTSNVDLLPTLANWMGKPLPGWGEGQTLPTSDDSPQAARPIYSMVASHEPQRGPLAQGTFALIKGGYKLIHYRGYPEGKTAYELYNLASDPEELDDRFTREKGLAEAMREELEEKLTEKTGRLQ